MCASILSQGLILSSVPYASRVRVHDRQPYKDFCHNSNILEYLTWYVAIEQVGKNTLFMKIINKYGTRYHISIEKHHICLRLGSYFMAAVWAAAIYSRRGFSLCLAGNTRSVMVQGGSTFHLKPGTIYS